MNQNDMNNSNVNNVQTNPEQVEYVNPRDIQPIELGSLRKDKIGKPMLALQLFALLVIVLIAIPIVSSMLQNENSALYQMLYGTSGPSTITGGDDEEQKPSNAKVKQELTGFLNMKYNSIILKNFVISDNFVSFKINSENGLAKLDDEELYLEIYSNSSDDVVVAVKLTGTYDYVFKDFKTTFANVKFNSSVRYYGKVVDMKGVKYPSHDIEQDPTGIGAFVCKKDGREIRYVFKNGYLIGINDKFSYDMNPSNEDAYKNLLKKYTDKKDAFGDLATVGETDKGFEYTCDIDLEADGFSYPSSYVDYEYYSSNMNDSSKDVDVIHYAMIGKGYDCK